MKKITELNKTCLINIPMIMDVIESTIDQLEIILTPYKDDFTKSLNSAKYEVKKNKKKYTHSWRDISITFEILAEKSYRNKIKSIELVFGYVRDENQNAIFFQVTDNFNEDIYASIPDTFYKGKGDEEDGLYVEFSIDESLSEAKIKDCAYCFTKYILQPLFEIQK